MSATVENALTNMPRSAIFALVLFCQFIPVAGPASAQSPAAVKALEGFLACQAIEKRKQRYRCYDALESGEAPVDAAPAPPAVAVAPPAVAVAPPAVAPPAIAVSPAIGEATKAQERRDFGQIESAKEKKELESITVQIVSATRSRSGKWTFRTSDGQIWRQANSKSARFRNQSFQAEISKAPLSGYYFRPADQRLRLRVKRIK